MLVFNFSNQVILMYESESLNRYVHQDDVIRFNTKHIHETTALLDISIIIGNRFHRNLKLQPRLRFWYMVYSGMINVKKCNLA